MAEEDNKPNGKSAATQKGRCLIEYDPAADTFSTSLAGPMPFPGLITALETMKITLIMQQQAQNAARQLAQERPIFGPDGMPFRH